MIKAQKMEYTDLASVLRIEQQANQFPWSKKNFEDCLKSKHYAWVFLDKEGDIIAYAIVQLVVDEAHLLNICVKESRQGQGLGREILDYIIAFSTDNKSVLIVLEVRSSNRRAQGMYLSSGFNEMAVRKGYYPAETGREDAILMGLDLDLISMFADK